MKTILSIIVAGSVTMLSGQNLQEKTAFHAAMHSNYNDVGPAYLTASSFGSPGAANDQRGNASQAIQLDGVDDYLSYPANAIYQKQLPISFSVWVYLDQLSGNFPVFSTDNSTAAYAGIVLQIANGTVYLGYGDGIGYGADNRSTIQSSFALTASKWYHISGVVRGFQNMDLYIDGVKDKSATYSGASSPFQMAYDGAGLSIGMYASKSGGAHQYFKGRIDDLHIWNREISELEVMFKKNLLLSYSVLPGGTLEDDGPFGLPVENQGFLYGKDRFNRNDQCMQMNGTSTLGKIPVSSAYKVQFPLTISAWVKINTQKVFQPIYASSDHINNKYSGIIFYLENGKPAITEGDNQGAGIQFRRSYVAGDSLKVGQWYHVVAVCSALGTTKMYVNGIEVSNGTASGTGNSMVHGTGNGYVGYLSEPNGGAARYFDGSIDELMVLSSTLTLAQVQSSFKPAVYFTTEPNDTSVDLSASLSLKTKAMGTLPVSYQWYHRVNGNWIALNLNKSSDLNIASVAIGDTGLYYCIASITGASDTSRFVRISLNPVNTLIKSTITNYLLAPNPVQNYIQIFNLKNQVEIQIVNAIGIDCFKGEIKPGESIPAENYASGIYYLLITDGQNVSRIKFIKN